VKRLGRLAGLLLALAVCGGCPAGPKGSPPNGRATAKPAKPAPPVPRKFPLELNGARLDDTYDQIAELIKHNGAPHVAAEWQEPSVTGILHVTPSDGSLQPADDYYFAGGKLVGLFKRFLLDDGGYTKVVESLAVNFDPGVVQPPAWAAADPFVSSLPTLQAPDSELFWQDAARQDLLVAERLHASNEVLACLFRPAACEKLGLSYSKLMQAFAAPPAK
jgi:hypothetical protein